MRVIAGGRPAISESKRYANNQMVSPMYQEIADQVRNDAVGLRLDIMRDTNPKPDVLSLVVIAGGRPAISDAKRYANSQMVSPMYQEIADQVRNDAVGLGLDIMRDTNPKPDVFSLVVIAGGRPAISNS